MKKFHELHYERPDYQQVRKDLKKYADEIGGASSYEELRRLWLSMKEHMQYVGYLEQYAYTCHLCGISYDFYKEEVRIQDIEDPHIAVLEKECDKVFLDSPYINQFAMEFGDKIVNQLKNNVMLSSEQTASLQSEENRLKTEYIELFSAGKKSEEISDRYYQILDGLITVRTKIAKTLGFKDYIEMAYRLHGRFDYGTEDITAFRNQIQQIFTPVCTEMRKTEVVNYPRTVMTSTDELITAVKNMFSDISRESGDYIDYILAHELLDMEDRPNKRPDWFSCCMHPYIKSPYIIGCFHGNSMEAIYLIHELAHGYAFYSAANTQMLYEYHRAVTSVNELQAKTMEHFAYPYLENFVGSQKKAFIRNHLFHQIENLPYRCAIDEFEHALYKDLRMTRTQRCELWAEIEAKYMPWRVSNPKDIKRGTYWPNQMHLFTHPFYYIEYDIAQINVFEFYGRSKDNYIQAWKDYSKLCHTGGSRNYLEILKVGNLTNPFVENSIAKICQPVIDEMFLLL